MFNLTDLTADDITIIGEGLDELKFKRVGKLIEKLRMQIAHQQQPNVEPVPSNMGVVDTRVDAVEEAA